MGAKTMTLPILFWPSVPLRDRARLPAKPGLYAVKGRFRVYYVGLSKNIRQRWTAKGQREHDRLRQAVRVPFCRIAYYPMRESAIYKAEKRLINRLNPPWNYTRVKSRWRLWVSDAIGTLIVCGCLVVTGIMIVELLG